MELRRYVCTVFDPSNRRVLATVDVEASNARRAADEVAADHWSEGSVVAQSTTDPADTVEVRRGW